MDKKRVAFFKNKLLLEFFFHLYIVSNYKHFVIYNRVQVDYINFCLQIFFGFLNIQTLTRNHKFISIEYN